MAPERLLFKGFTEDLKSSYELLVRLGKADLQIRPVKDSVESPGARRALQVAGISTEWKDSQDWGQFVRLNRSKGRFRFQLLLRSGRERFHH